MPHHRLGFSRYLPVNQEALLWEIYCNDAGCTQIPPGSNYPPRPDIHPKSFAETVATGRVLREFQIVYITAGEGWFEDSLHSKRQIQAGDIFILFPGIKHAYSPSKETGWQEYWVGFSGDHAMRLYENGLLDPKESLQHIGINRELMADYEQIVQLCREQTPGFQIRLGALVMQLLAHIHTTTAKAQTSNIDSETVRTARSIMMLHLEAGIEVEELALQAGVSYNHLLEIFRKYTGLTPYNYFLQLRIHYAKKLLQEKEISVKEVAARMNFENQYYFSRLFKRKTGYSPTQWRNGHLPD